MGLPPIINQDVSVTLVIIGSSNNISGDLFLDFKINSDTVNHEILLGKLKLHRCQDVPIRWF